MAAIEVGRICVKTRGREAGKKAVIVEMGKEFAIIDGPKVRRRKCNIRHLFPTGETVKIAKGAKHEEIVKVMAAVAGTAPAKAIGVKVKE
ncbi:MAG: 50S ribosomal protein L14e [Candidatus Diapherotrites archaeon]|nr:50S ribosomal protein L14e [Candidatus Micrarchaeota archaeon]MBU1940006.1 50S ribosomal protein L14e [Candidatus Micrarchaeota archaeon]